MIDSTFTMTCLKKQIIYGSLLWWLEHWCRSRPSATWTSDALWNFPRWVNKDNDQLLADALDVSIFVLTKKKRKQLYVDWQKLVNEEVPMIPVGEVDEVYAASKRLKGLTLGVNGTKFS